MLDGNVNKLFTWRGVLELDTEKARTQKRVSSDKTLEGRQLLGSERHFISFYFAFATESHFILFYFAFASESYFIYFIYFICLTLVLGSEGLRIEGVEMRTVTDEELQEAETLYQKAESTLNATQQSLSRMVNLSGAISQRHKHYQAKFDAKKPETDRQWEAAARWGAISMENATVPCEWTARRIGTTKYNHTDNYNYPN